MFYRVVLRFSEKNRPEVKITKKLKTAGEKWFVPDRAYYHLVWDEYVGWFLADSEDEAKRKAVDAFKEGVTERRKLWDGRLCAVREIELDLLEETGSED